MLFRSQGNILAVVNTASGALEQSTDYYPYGLPHADAAGADRNRRKFGAKELISEYALHEYDFSARRLPAIIPAFSQPDPLAEKYHWLSPYAYCAADPINLIDPTGMKIDLSQLSDDDLEIFNKWRSFTMKESKAFKSLYEILDDSYKIYIVTLENSIEVNGVEKGGVFELNSNGGYLKLLKTSDIKNMDSRSSIEEFFHAYQNENSDLYSGEAVNLEFEAKLFSIFAYDIGAFNFGIFSSDNQYVELQTIKEQFYQYCNGQSEIFINWLQNSCANFSKYYKNIPNTGKHYHTPTSTSLPSLKKFYLLNKNIFE